MGARPGGAGEAPDILDQCLLGPQITISQDEAPSLKEKGWVEGWPTRFVAGRRDLYSELPCESEARLAAMAARIAPPDRWTINPHFVRGTFYQEQRIDPIFMCNRKPPHLRQGGDTNGLEKRSKSGSRRARHADLLPRRSWLV